MAEEVGEGQVKKRRITSKDFEHISEFVLNEFDRRKQRRNDKERIWDEVDRQIALKPDRSRKCDERGNLIPELTWRSELELPLQATALEVLKSDALRLSLPADGPWFAAHVLASDEVLERFDLTNLVAGDRNEVPSLVDQENVNDLMVGWHQHWHRQYPFRETWDKLHGEAFKYGAFAGRARLVRKRVFETTSSGTVSRDRVIPMLVPRSVRNVYLDDSAHAMANEGVWVGPSVIAQWPQRLVDLTLAAVRGSNSPDNPQGGWLPKNLTQIEGDKDGVVQVVEYEGDMVLPRKTTRSVFLPNVVVTVVKGKSRNAVVRIRFNQLEFPTYLAQSYDPDERDVYSSSPLMKGAPIQKAATEAFNRLMDWAVLNTEPPLQYDPQDPAFAGAGGPRVGPRELWETLSEINVVQIGDGAALMQLYLALLAQYSDLTGINAPRLGAQTVSHTTAFAKDVEQQRGQIRTVDYVGHVRDSPMTQWLYMENVMGRKAMPSEMEFYAPAFQSHVRLTSKQVPSDVVYTVFGAVGPALDLQQTQTKLRAVQAALQMEVLKRQIQPDAPPLDINQVQRHFLREGGFTDVDPFFAGGSQGVSGSTQNGPDVLPAIASSADPALAVLEGGS